MVFVISQKVLKINKFVLGGVVFIGGGLVFFNWIYHRTEPKFLTPIVDRIAPFFPTAGAYETKQATTPDTQEVARRETAWFPGEGGEIGRSYG